ncbi:hypothetical protein BD309DRAFT_510260 [Dichomitus squalens]|uniref:Uncharacterized protein n=1 Tax=Dichomitus squalens TaxID=114155 RepID=A0A4Q9NZC4_9APHY|nr:hypothetical protein BD309DRAFT_510260 [Dichomitus squalens]TBU64494.1 hypothetical protein BD310DRAFT_400143 [Dichomitus squalens]
MPSVESVPISKILGPVMLGVCVNAFSNGFSVLHFVQYCTRLSKDPRPNTQPPVTWTFSVDTAHTVAHCLGCDSHSSSTISRTLHTYLRRNGRLLPLPSSLPPSRD